MKRIIYVCDFCGEDRPDNEVTGFYWIPGDQLEIRHIAATERHLCDVCLYAFKNVLKEYTVADRPQKETSK